jgi:hypothetical protein
LRLARSVVWTDGASFRLTGTYLGLNRPHLGLARTGGLYLWMVVRFAGTKARTRLWLSGLRDLAGPGAGLTGAIDFARATAWVGTCNSGLCGNRAGSRDQGGAASVYVVKLLTVLCGFALDLDLGRHWRSAWAAEGFDLGRPRAHVNAASAAVVGDARVVVHDDGAVVDVVDAGDIDAVDGAVVVEVVALPIAAVVAIAGVAEAIVDAAVETDVEAPVAAMKAPAVVIPTPVAGGPESTVVGWSAPGAGNPIVAGRAPVPVTGGPDIVWGWGLGLLVFGQRRWGFVGVFDWYGLTFLIELFVGLSVLVGLVLIGRWRGCLLRLLRVDLRSIRLGDLLRLSLRADSENLSLSGGRGGLCLAIVDWR